MQALTFINSIDGMHAPVPSDISRRRYWRLLDRIYDFAMLHGLCRTNPAQEIAETDRPPTELSLAAILSPRMWGALPKTLPTQSGTKHTRSRAILSVLIDTACAPRELANLRLQDVIRDESGQICSLFINGKNEYERRTLPVTPSTAMLIQEWLGVRHQYGPHAALPWLFLARKGKIFQPKLHTLVTQQLLYTALVSRLPEPPRTGAQIVRNTAIIYWLLSGISIHDVIKMAGFKSIKGMAHLRMHMPAHLRQAINASSPA